MSRSWAREQVCASGDDKRGEEMKKSPFLIGVGLFCLFSLAALLAHAAPPAETLKIGLMGTLSGPGARGESTCRR